MMSPELPEFDLSDGHAAAFCPSCGSGYRAGASRCTDCDSELMTRAWAEARASENRFDDSPVPLADIESAYRAHVLGSLLNDEGIWFATQTSRWGAVQFLVHPRDLDVARDVLSDLDELPDTPPEIPDRD